YFTPVVTTLVAMSVVFRYLYHPHYGLLNHALGLAGIGPIDWLGDPRWAMPAIVLLNVWRKFGYNMLILLAGLRAIPDDLYAAAIAFVLFAIMLAATMVQLRLQKERA